MEWAACGVTVAVGAGVATETCLCWGRGWCGGGFDYESEGERFRPCHRDL